MSGFNCKLVLLAVLVAAVPALAQDKGEEDETGAYQVVENWPQPWSKAGYIWGSTGQRATEPKAELRNSIVVIDIRPKLRQPNDIFISDDDKVWVVDGTNARLLQFDKTGKRLYWWGTYGMRPGQFWEPHQISLDAEGNLYIADSFGGRTQKYSPSKSGDRARLLAPGK